MCPMIMKPGGVFKVVLQCDREDPNPPTFLFRRMTVAQAIDVLQVKDLFDDPEARKKMSGAELIEKAVSVIQKSLAGWARMTDDDGQEIPFDRKRLPELVTMQEAFELLNAMVEGQQPEVADLKKSESPSPSDSASSAKAAGDRRDAPRISSGSRPRSSAPVVPEAGAPSAETAGTSI